MRTILYALLVQVIGIGVIFGNLPPAEAGTQPTVQFCYGSGPRNQPTEDWSKQTCYSRPAPRGNWHLTQVIVRDGRGAYDVLRAPRMRTWNGYQTGEVLLCINKTNRYPIETDGINDANDVTVGMWVRCEEYGDTYGKRY
jgi:hypothetical protein